MDVPLAIALIAEIAFALGVIAVLLARLLPAGSPEEDAASDDVTT